MGMGSWGLEKIERRERETEKRNISGVKSQSIRRRRSILRSIHSSQVDSGLSMNATGGSLNDAEETMRGLFFRRGKGALPLAPKLADFGGVSWSSGVIHT